MDNITLAEMLAASTVLRELLVVVEELINLKRAALANQRPPVVKVAKRAIALVTGQAAIDPRKG